MRRRGFLKATANLALLAMPRLAKGSKPRILRFVPVAGAQHSIRSGPEHGQHEITVISYSIHYMASMKRS